MTLVIIFSVIIIIIILIILLATIAIAHIIYLRRRERDAVDPVLCIGTTWEHKAPFIREAAGQVATLPSEDIYTLSKDGLKLYAKLITTPAPKGVIILMHGYRSMAKNDFSLIINFYRSLGLDVLLADQRSHGKSEGKWITFGIKERYDAVSWARVVMTRYGQNFPVIINGVSMGASTVLMGSGIGYPENVRGIIADCGFTSPYEIIKTVAKKKKLPLSVVMPLAEVSAKLFAGFDIKEASTISAMSSNFIPVLFIHGSEDNFVPCDMSISTFNACLANKHIVLVEGAGHGDSYITDKDLYEKSLKEFIIPKILNLINK
jgi:fermentation-respiration switch protein FrsA (DUF1100 family)